jgi:MFS transporter, FSR family, fosmidomycin resistance protein
VAGQSSATAGILHLHKRRAILDGAQVTVGRASDVSIAGEQTVAEETTVRRDERRATGVACGAHALHDGYTDVIFVLLPVWQAEFGLGYAEVGMLRGLYAGTMATFQIPAALLAERLGVAPVLGLGTALAGLGYCLAGASTGFALLVLALALGGIGSSTQHPLGSALMARAFAGPRSLKALGTYNFAGDIGKMTVPAAAALLLTAMSWRPAVALLGAFGVVCAAAIFWLTPRYPTDRTTDGQHQKSGGGGGEPVRSRIGFPVLLSIGVIDSAVRMTFLTFLPFLLTAKGAGLPTIGLALTLVFAGGAAGKLVCAFIGDRIGAIATVWLTEGLTALTILVLLPLPLEAGMVLLPVIGIALNGTSSVLYGSVPDVVAPERRGRAFSVFYTGSIGAGAIAPVLFGLVGDRFGVTVALVVVACAVLTTLPLALALKRALPVRQS